MDDRWRRWVTALGPVVGIFLLLYVINQGVDQFRQGEETMRIERRAEATATASAQQEAESLEPVEDVAPAAEEADEGEAVDAEAVEGEAVEEPAAEQVPAEETPAEETPAEETPAEETPAEDGDTPVDDATDEEGASN